MAFLKYAFAPILSGFAAIGMIDLSEQSTVAIVLFLIVQAGALIAAMVRLMADVGTMKKSLDKGEDRFTLHDTELKTLREENASLRERVAVVEQICALRHRGDEG